MLGAISHVQMGPLSVSTEPHMLQDGNLTERTVISKWFGSELWQKENQCYSAP